jgi:hypothetical protein
VRPAAAAGGPAERHGFGDGFVEVGGVGPGRVDGVAVDADDGRGLGEPVPAFGQD